jgi:AcrR family transcriptional regulator
MNWHVGSKMPADGQPYHHGNLKQTLLDASIELIRAVGPAAFTMREVARKAGVSHNAPYRHFQDKEALLAAVAAEGFDRLTESMRKTAQPASGAPERLRLAARGYVKFSLRFPEHFSVMFDSPKHFDVYPETRKAGEGAFGLLVHHIEGCQQEGALPQGDSRQFALIAWSMVHGVAKLAGAGQFPFRKLGKVLDFTDLASKALLQGMKEN